MLIAHVQKIVGSDSFSVDEDYFWSVPLSETNNVYSDPRALTVGQVSESWSNIESIIADDRIISYGLIWFADVLRAIGKETNG